LELIVLLFGGLLEAGRDNPRDARGWNMESGHKAFRLVVGGTISVGIAGAILAFAGVDTPARVPAVLLFLIVGPAVAVASLLPGLDVLAKTVIGVTAAVVINAGVAAAMLVVGIWSPLAGLAAVALISATLAAAKRFAGISNVTGSGAVPTSPVSHK
jgi:hypothetical protein